MPAILKASLEHLPSLGAKTVEIIINGKNADGNYETVNQLLKERDLDPKLVVVELNGSILPKADYESTRLKEGDAVEIVQFVAGG